MVSVETRDCSVKRAAVTDRMGLEDLGILDAPLQRPVNLVENVDSCRNSVERDGRKWRKQSRLLRGRW